MGFLDDLKDNAQKAFDAAKEVGGKAVEKGKDLAQQGKLGMEVLSIDNKIKDLKIDIFNFALEKELFKSDDTLNEKMNQLNELKNQKEAKEKEIEKLK